VAILKAFHYDHSKYEVAKILVHYNTKKSFPTSTLNILSTSENLQLYNGLHINVGSGTYYWQKDMWLFALDKDFGTHPKTFLGMPYQ
jgi:hypothetical protein